MHKLICLAHGHNYTLLDFKLYRHHAFFLLVRFLRVFFIYLQIFLETNSANIPSMHSVFLNVVIHHSEMLFQCDFCFCFSISDLMRACILHLNSVGVKSPALLTSTHRRKMSRPTNLNTFIVLQ